MYSKRSEGDGPDTRPVRTSDRLRSRPKVYGRTYVYYPSPIIRSNRKKNKTRTAAAQIAKLLSPGNRARTSKANVMFLIYLCSSYATQFMLFVEFYVWCKKS